MRPDRRSSVWYGPELPHMRCRAVDEADVSTRRSLHDELVVLMPAIPYGCHAAQDGEEERKVDEHPG